jgi:hypothetical protein
MRGSSDPQLAMLTSLSTEDLIPPEHPIRKNRTVVDAVLAVLDDTIDEMYAAGGRRSVPSKMLLTVVDGVDGDVLDPPGAGVLRAAQSRPAVQVVLGHAHRPASLRRHLFTKNR